MWCIKAQLLSLQAQQMHLDYRHNVTSLAYCSTLHNVLLLVWHVIHVMWPCAYARSTNTLKSCFLAQPIELLSHPSNRVDIQVNFTTRTSRSKIPVMRANLRNWQGLCRPYSLLSRAWLSSAGANSPAAFCLPLLISAKVPRPCFSLGLLLQEILESYILQRSKVLEGLLQTIERRGRGSKRFTRVAEQRKEQRFYSCPCRYTRLRKALCSPWWRAVNRQNQESMFSTDHKSYMRELEDVAGALHNKPVVGDSWFWSDGLQRALTDSHNACGILRA